MKLKTTNATLELVRKTTHINLTGPHAITNAN